MPALVMVVASCAVYDAPERNTKAGGDACQVARVIDGDTADMNCGRGVERMRLMGFDAPEKFSPMCREEYRRALEAEEQLAALLARGGVTANRHGVDRYGRVLAQVNVGGEDVAEAMIAAGHARAYAGGWRRGWCA